MFHNRSIVSEIILIFLIVSVIIISVSITGCLSQGDQGKPQLNKTPVTTTPEISNHSSIRIVKSAEVICVGDTLNFTLVNEGTSTLVFGQGSLHTIQYYRNGRWEDVFIGKETQGEFVLHPGERYTNLSFPPKDPREYYTGLDNPPNLAVIQPGIYRIEFSGKDYATGSAVQNTTFFSIDHCPSGVGTRRALSNQYGVCIVKSADTICMGEILDFTIANEGNSIIGFGEGNPFYIQYYLNGKWENIYAGGGTQGYWALHPGKEFRHNKFPSDFSSVLYEYYSTPVPPYPEFIVTPGLYQIKFFGESTEFSTILEITDCQESDKSKGDHQ